MLFVLNHFFTLQKSSKSRDFVPYIGWFLRTGIIFSSISENLLTTKSKAGLLTTSLEIPQLK